MARDLGKETDRAEAIKNFIRVKSSILVLDANTAPYTDTDLMNLNGGLFFIACALSFPFVFGVVLMFPRMKTVMKREYHSGLYKLGPAYLGIVTAQLPLSFLLPLLFSEFEYLKWAIWDPLKKKLFQYRSHIFCLDSTLLQSRSSTCI